MSLVGPMIAIQDRAAAERIMTPRWKVGDTWEVDICFFNSPNELDEPHVWVRAKELFRVKAAPSPESDRFSVVVTPHSNLNRLREYTMTFRRDPFSLASYDGLTGLVDNPRNIRPFPYSLDIVADWPLSFPTLVGTEAPYPPGDDHYQQNVFSDRHKIVFHQEPVVREPLTGYSHYFEWRDGDPWWSAYRSNGKDVGDDYELHDYLHGLARLVSVNGKATGYGWPRYAGLELPIEGQSPCGATP